MRTPFGRLAAFAVIAMLFCVSITVAAESDPSPSTRPAAVKEAEKSGDGTQQNKMKSCNEQAAKKSLKGDERKAFMSSCLKGPRGL